MISGPFDAEEMKRFLDSFFYVESAFLVDEIVSADAEKGHLLARLDSKRVLPYTQLQRTGPGHPAHVAAAGDQCSHRVWFLVVGETAGSSEQTKSRSHLHRCLRPSEPA